MGKRGRVTSELLIFGLVFSLPFPVFTQVASSQPDLGPVISSVSPISATRLQTIVINGSGFGDTPPETSSHGDGSVNTIDKGETPSMQIRNEATHGGWTAGFQDSTDRNAIGIILENWSDNEIVLGGFGTALDTYSRWSLNVGDPMRIVVITSGGKAEYKTTAVAGSGMPPDDYPNSTLPTPDLAVSCQSSTKFSDFRVEVSGSLTYNGTGVAGAPILLSYSVSGGNSWNELTQVNSDDNGDFSAVWMLFVTGNYLLKAEWSGNANYTEASTEISFVVAPSDEQNLISVASTSTISSFAFNSTSGQLVFDVSGPSGTTGQVYVYIPKSLVPDVFDLQVFLDENPVSYDAESIGDSWLVTFTYSHSKHAVTVNLNSTHSTPINVNAFWQWTTYGTIIALSLTAAVLLISKKEKTPATPKRGRL